jgi:hypothetical protein
VPRDCQKGFDLRRLATDAIVLIFFHGLRHRSRGRIIGTSIQVDKSPSLWHLQERNSHLELLRGNKKDRAEAVEEVRRGFMPLGSL